MSNTSKKVVAGGVAEYIDAQPDDVQEKLKTIRAAIKQVAPDAIETVSYFEIPGYCYEGYDYNGMFAWFSYKKPYIRIHVRPPVPQDYAHELKGCKISTGIIGFPEENEVDAALIQKLVRASVDVMKSGSST